MSRHFWVALGGLCALLVACAGWPGAWLPAEQQIARLPWPADGLYGMALDGYLGYLESESKHLQFNFIHVTRQSGPSDLSVERADISTSDGKAIQTTHCNLIPGSATRSYQLYTVECTLQDPAPGGYVLAAVHLETDRGAWDLPLGNLTLEVLPGAPPDDLYVSRWHLQSASTREYRALLVNGGNGEWRMAGLHPPALPSRVGQVVSIRSGADYNAGPATFSSTPLLLAAHSSGAVQLLFTHDDATMVVFRPVARIHDVASGQTRLVPLQTSFYTPAFSPRDILAFTRSPRHLRTLGEAITRPVPGAAGDP